MAPPEEHARQTTDQLLGAGGWEVCDPQDAHITAPAGRGHSRVSGQGWPRLSGLLTLRLRSAAGDIEIKKGGHQPARGGASGREIQLWAAAQSCPWSRVDATVGMIATVTDIKAVEVVLVMRAVISRACFGQMKGPGVRVIKPDDLQSVIADARAKNHLAIVDAVDICERDKTDSRLMPERICT